MSWYAVDYEHDKAWERRITEDDAEFERIRDCGYHGTTCEYWRNCPAWACFGDEDCKRKETEDADE